MQGQPKKWEDKISLGSLQLQNRLCMAALTRQRCDPQDGIPTDLLTQYYSQRATAGLILTQATAWCQRGEAFPGAANLYTKEHMEGWKRVIDEVHKKEGKIFCQIFHGGRATHEKINKGLEVWGPSAIRVRQEIRTLPGTDYPIPKQMSMEQIQQTKELFRKSIILSKECGFDGIQLHGAHGYLIDSFLRSCTNKRTDKYGGSPENRSRFCLQLCDIALQFYQPFQVGLKISPVSRLRDMFDEKPVETYSYLLKELSSRKIGFLQVRQSCQVLAIQSKYEISPPQQIENVCKTLRPYFNGILIANDSFEPQSGIQKIRKGEADMISFGRLYISNPDLAERVLKGKEINKNWDVKTFYGYQHGAKGYTDYQFYKQN